MKLLLNEIIHFRISVRLGEHTISKNKDCNDYSDPFSCSDHPVEDILVESTIPHENYNSEAKVNDIALIRLSRDVELSRSRRDIKTICLPLDVSQQVQNAVGDKQNLLIAGWGLTGASEAMSDVLMKAFVPYFPQELCKLEFQQKMQKYSRLKINIQDTHMCAGNTSVKIDTCKGDSGSALMGLAAINEKLKMFQHGIVSIGVDCTGTEPFPGIYTRVSMYINWILDNMSKE